MYFGSTTSSAERRSTSTRPGSSCTAINDTGSVGEPAIVTAWAGASLDKRGEGGIRRGHLLEASGLGIDDSDSAGTLGTHLANDSLLGFEGVGCHAEQPLGRAELHRQLDHRFNASRAPAVKVPPIVPVRDEVEDAVRRPGRLKDRLLVSARQLPGVLKATIIGQLRDPQLSPVPGHPGMIPGQPAQLRTGWR